MKDSIFKVSTRMGNKEKRVMKGEISPEQMKTLVEKIKAAPPGTGNTVVLDYFKELLRKKEEEMSKKAKMSKKGGPVIEVIQPLKGHVALVSIDGVLAQVKIHWRLKHKDEEKDGPLCEHGYGFPPGTWIAMKFDNPEIKKRKDYKAVWKAVFLALELGGHDFTHSGKEPMTQTEAEKYFKSKKGKAESKKREQEIHGNIEDPDCIPF
jgi:hypothetical protein